MLYRNMFPLTGNGKYISMSNHIFMQTVPNAKDSQKLGTLEIHIIRMIQFLLLPFLPKLTSPFHPHPKQYTIFSADLYAASW